MKDMYGIRADELDMHSIIAESIIGFLLQHTGIMIQRQDISMNSSVCAAAVPLLPRFGISPESLLNECESVIKSLHLPDLDLKCKIQNQIELMGYIDLTTNKKEDRRKLLITDVFPLSSKKDNTVWGYAAQTRSIGSGKVSRLTIRSSVYAKTPVKRFDIIYAKELEKNRSGYWYLLDYDLIA